MIEGPTMRRGHTKADETPEWWFQQIEIAQKVARDVWGKRGHYRKELHDIYNHEVPELVIGIEDSGKEGGSRYQFPAVHQVDLLYLPRHKEWTKSRAYDIHPRIRFPRTGPNDNIYGEMLETIAKGVAYESNELYEWRQTIDDVMAYGSFAVWYGIGSHAQDALAMARAAVSADQAVEMVKAAINDPDGIEYKAHPGQAHDVIAKRLREVAYDPETLHGPGGARVMDDLLAAAGLHDVQGESENKRGREIAVERNEVWCQRSPIGSGTLWAGDVDDYYDSRWVARRLVFDVDIARRLPSFRPSVASRLDAGVFSKDDGFRGDAAGAEGEDANKIVSNKVVIFEVWDRKYHERHYIARGVDKFLERQAFDPHEGAIKGFVPCTYSAPLRSTKASPQRPYGIPAASNLWPIQAEIIRYASWHAEAVKKMGVRMTQSFGPLGDQEDAFVAGITGTNIEVPSEFREMFAKGSDYVRPLQLGSIPKEFFFTLESLIVKLGHLGAWPLSQLTGAPQSSTATGETVAVQGGESQMGDLIREMQKAFAFGQSIKMALVKKWYTADQLKLILPARYFTPLSTDEKGQPGPSMYDLWMASSSEGDEVTAEFNPGNEDPVRRNQLREAIEFASSLPGPAPGLPMYDAKTLMPWIRELFQTFHVDAPEPTKYTDEQIQQAIEMAAEQSQRGGQNKGEGKTKRSSRTFAGQRPSSGKASAGTQDVRR